MDGPALPVRRRCSQQRGARIRVTALLRLAIAPVDRKITHYAYKRSVSSNFLVAANSLKEPLTAKTQLAVDGRLRKYASQARGCDIRPIGSNLS
jgi:hypothetical protein